MRRIIQVAATLILAPFASAFLGIPSNSFQQHGTASTRQRDHHAVRLHLYLPHENEASPSMPLAKTTTNKNEASSTPAAAITPPPARLSNEKDTASSSSSSSSTIPVMAHYLAVQIMTKAMSLQKENKINATPNSYIYTEATHAADATEAAETIPKATLDKTKDTRELEDSRDKITINRASSSSATFSSAQESIVASEKVADNDSTPLDANALEPKATDTSNRTTKLSHASKAAAPAMEESTAAATGAKKISVRRINKYLPVNSRQRSQDANAAPDENHPLDQASINVAASLLNAPDARVIAATPTESPTKVHKYMPRLEEKVELDASTTSSSRQQSAAEALKQVESKPPTKRKAAKKVVVRSSSKSKQQYLPLLNSLDGMKTPKASSSREAKTISAKGFAKTKVRSAAKGQWMPLATLKKKGRSSHQPAKIEAKTNQFNATAVSAVLMAASNFSDTLTVSQTSKPVNNAVVNSTVVMDNEVEDTPLNSADAEANATYVTIPLASVSNNENIVSRTPSSAANESTIVNENILQPTAEEAIQSPSNSPALRSATTLFTRDVATELKGGENEHMLDNEPSQPLLRRSLPTDAPNDELSSKSHSQLFPHGVDAVLADVSATSSDLSPVTLSTDFEAWEKESDFRTVPITSNKQPAIQNALTEAAGSAPSASATFEIATNASLEGLPFSLRETNKKSAEAGLPSLSPAIPVFDKTTSVVAHDALSLKSLAASSSVEAESSILETAHTTVDALSKYDEGLILSKSSSESIAKPSIAPFSAMNVTAAPLIVESIKSEQHAGPSSASNTSATNVAEDIVTPPTPKWMNSPFGKKLKAANPGIGNGYLEAIVGLSAPSPSYPRAPPVLKPAKQLHEPVDVIEHKASLDRVDARIPPSVDKRNDFSDSAIVLSTAPKPSLAPTETEEVSYVIKPNIDLESIAASLKMSLDSRSPAILDADFTSSNLVADMNERANKCDTGDEEVSLDIDSLDWRAFRAKLVMSEPKVTDDEDMLCDAMVEECDDLDGIGGLYFDRSTTKTKLEKMTPLDQSQWAYDSGRNIEKGTVILGGVEQDFGFSLRQQYFHKAAILVLDHQEDTFTKGIILNRPTDFELEDDLNPGVRYRVWFGGDVQGIHSERPDLVCLHSIDAKEAQKASVPIMNGLQWTTFKNAKRLVKAGVARAEDFQVFCGYAGWGPSVLRSEVDRSFWYTVATDSHTLIKELGQIASSDPREAGLETWYLLMNMIGRDDVAQRHDGGFDDMMLKEWSLHKLLSNVGGGCAGPKKRILDGLAGQLALVVKSPAHDNYSKPASFVAHCNMAGCLVRASANGRSPFLLQDQELHKSVILIVMDDDKLTVGAILNRPAAEGLDLPAAPRNRGLCCSQKFTMPLRFGGQYTLKNDEPLLWVHCSEKLRRANVGFPMNTVKGGIWKVKAEEVTRALTRGLATMDDFLVVTGVSAWTKEGAKGGIQDEIEAGTFEMVPVSKIQSVWNALSKQKVLKFSTLQDNMSIANDAWAKAGWDASDAFPKHDGRQDNTNDSEPCVFKCQVKVSDLADEALTNWVATFLLGVPVEAFS
ncbi:hypothetical protein MPSEU_000827700 [Mayamaea pseudoterrestris]|nr:hypothetical protein MPSEU_000827700 [Mayamaea pseudoterrestris]